MIRFHCQNFILLFAGLLLICAIPGSNNVSGSRLVKLSDSYEEDDEVKIETTTWAHVQDSRENSIGIDDAEKESAVYFDTKETENGDSTTTFATDTDTMVINEEEEKGESTTPQSSNSVKQDEKPNVILIIADDLGFNDVSFHGSPQIPTPNIDALAFSGVILNSYYVSPICTPSRTAIYSGRHPIHTGMQHDVIYGTTPYGFPLQYKLLPQFLKELDYDTALVGKWHMGHFQRKYTPTCRGFDRHYGHWTGHKDYYDNMAQEENPQAWGYDMRRNFDPAYENFGRYSTDLYTEEAASIIRSHNKSKPLFLTISHTAVHSANPYQLLQAPKENVDGFEKTIPNLQRRTFAAMVQKMDDSVGEVVKELFEAQMLENSIIIFTSDNGGPAEGFNGNAASNWPLRGVKNTLWEGGVRGAALIWSPYIEQSARGVSNQLMHIQDWLPTILKAVGINEPSWITGDIDGIDMWDTIRLGLPSPRSELLHNIDDIYGNEAVRVGNWKLLHGTTYGGRWDQWYGPSGRETAKVRDKSSTMSTNSTSTALLADKSFRWARRSVAGKIVHNLGMFPKSSERIFEILRQSEIVCNRTNASISNKKATCNLLSGEYCLFNIEEDPCEVNNLAQDMPEVVEQLTEALKAYRDTAVPPINKPKDSRGLPIYWNYTWNNFGDYLGTSETKSLCS